MDYGQQGKTSGASVFFTPGVGVNDPNMNDVGAENNIDSTNQQIDWSSPLERDQRNIGNLAMNSSEMPNSPETEVSIERAPVQLNTEIEMAMPPGAEKTPDAKEIAEQAISFDRNSIKTGEKLNEAGVHGVNSLIEGLKKSGDTSQFYDDYIEMKAANLKNSYGREIGK